MRAVPLICLVSLVCNSTQAVDWAQFRGPNGAATSAEQVPVEWSATKNLAWKVRLPGRGTSSPITVGDKIFVTCFSGYGVGREQSDQGQLRRHLVCVNRSGRILWDKSVPAVLPEDTHRGFITGHGYASSTPVSDGKHVYVFYGKTGVLAYDLAGNRKWQVSVGKGSDPRGWGSAASPILYKDKVIINAMVEGQAVFALKKETGKVAWRASAPGYGQCWSTPILVKTKDRTELVINVPNEMWGLNPDTGKLRWYADVLPGGAMCTSMIAHGDVVFAIGGRRNGAAAVRLGGKGDVTRSHVVWSNNLGSYVTSPVLHKGNLYWVSDRGIAFCANAKSGQTVYRKRLSNAGPIYGSATLIGGKIYVPTRYNGVFVIEAKPKFKQLALNKLPDESLFNASPAVSPGCLYLRSDRFLYCIAKQEKSEKKAANRE